MVPVLLDHEAEHASVADMIDDTLGNAVTQVSSRGARQVPGARPTTVTVTGTPITINITTTSADPKAIGDAAVNAVHSLLRRLTTHPGRAVGTLRQVCPETCRNSYGST